MSTLNEYASPISELIDLSKLPEGFDVLISGQNGISQLLSNIKFKNYFTSRNATGETAYHSITIVTKALELPLIGDEFKLIFFKGSENSLSEIPLALQVTWGIRKYFTNFKLKEFSFSPEAFINPLLEIAGLDNNSLVESVIGVFLEDDEDGYGTICDSIKAQVELFSNSDPSVDNEIDSIKDAIDSIKSDLSNVIVADSPILLKDVFKNYSNFGTLDQSILSINNALKTLSDDHDINIDLKQEILIAALSLAQNFEEKLGKLIDVFKKKLGNITKEQIEQLLVPQFEIELVDIPMALELPRSILLPLSETAPGIWEVDNSQVGNPAKPVNASINFTSGPVRYSTKTGFEININENQSITLPRCRIPGTELDLEFIGVKIDLSRKWNIPEADKDGRPADFMGAYITEGTVYLPTFWNQDSANSTAEIKARNLLVGTGGLSGTLGMAAKQGVTSTPLVKANLGGGFAISLDAFDLTFQQNEIISSNIYGTLTIPNFKNKNASSTDPDVTIGIDVFIGKSGFEITAKPQTQLSISIPNVFDYDIKSLSLGKDDGKFYLETSGQITLTLATGGESVLPTPIDIKGFRIWQDGKVELRGGGIPLPKALTLKVGPAKLSITAIHFGSHEQVHGGQLRQYNYFGFDGGISLDPGGVDARGDGIKFYYTTDTDAANNKPFHFFVGIEGIGIAIKIPGTASEKEAALILKGYLAIKNPSDADENSEGGKQYVGAISFAMPKMKMGGSAAMRLNPKNKSFIVDAALELSTPIALGTTGLGIYGFRGLVGKKYTVAKTKIIDPLSTNDQPAQGADEVTWWEYYKKKGLGPFPDIEGVNIDKFDDSLPGFSIGAGVSLATTPDSGKSFSSKLFLLLSLPEVLLLQGQAAVAAERLGLDSPEEPPFRAILAIDSNSVQAGFGFTKNIDDDGKILKLNGELEMAYFFKDSSAWYVNAGRDLPEEKRISARILSLFDGYAYLMLSAKGIKAGAGIGYELEKKYGPVGVDIGAHMDMMGYLNFRPTQIGGALDLGGHARINVFKFKMGFELGAGIAAEAPKPFIVQGYAFINIDLPKPFKDYGIRVEFLWNKNSELNTTPIKLMNVVDGIPAQAINIMSQESFQLAYHDTSGSAAGQGDQAFPADPDSWLNPDLHTIPMDSYIDFELSNSVLPDYSSGSMAKFIGVTGSPDHEVLTPPNKSISKQVQHKLTINDVKIKYWDAAAASPSWKDYDPYAAATPVKNLPDVSSIINDLPWGSWQWMDGPDKCNRLRVMANNPFSYMTQGSSYYSNEPEFAIEDQGFDADEIFCPKLIDEYNDQDWLPIALGTLYEYDQFHTDRELIYRSLKRKQGLSYQASLLAGWLYKYPGQGGAIVAQIDNAISYFTDRKGTSIRGGDRFEIYVPKPSKYVRIELLTFAENTTVSFYHKKQSGTSPTGTPTYEYEHLITKNVDLAMFFRHVSHQSDDRSIDKVVVNAGTCTTHVYSFFGTFSAIQVTVLNEKNGLEGDKGTKEGEITGLSATLTNAVQNGDPDAELYRYQLKVKQKELEEISTKLDTVTAYYNDVTTFLTTYSTNYELQAIDVMAAYEHLQEEVQDITERMTNRLYTMSQIRYQAEENESVPDEMIRLFMKFNGMLDAVNNYGGALPPYVDTDIAALVASFQPTYDSIKVDLFAKGLITEQECVYEPGSGQLLYCYTSKMLIAWQNFQLLDPPTQTSLLNAVNTFIDSYKNTLRSIYITELHTADPVIYPQPAHYTQSIDSLAEALNAAKYAYVAKLKESELSAGLSGQLTTLDTALDAITSTCQAFLSTRLGDNSNLASFNEYEFHEAAIGTQEKAENATISLLQCLAHPSVDPATETSIMSNYVSMSLVLEQVVEEFSVLDYYDNPDLLGYDALNGEDETLLNAYKTQAQNVYLDYSTVLSNISSLPQHFQDGINALDGHTQVFVDEVTNFVLTHGDVKVRFIRKIQLPSDDPNVLIYKIVFHAYRLSLYGELLANNTFWGIRSCCTYVYNVRWREYYWENYENTLRPPEDILEDTKNMIKAQQKTIQPTWRPNTKFAIQLALKDTVKAGDDDPNPDTDNQYYTFGFMTKGPLGHYHSDLYHDIPGVVSPYRSDDAPYEPVQYISDYRQLIEDDREKEYKLASLQEYIDYNRSYPDPSGSLIGNKPMYFENIAIDLFFAQQYVYTMFSNWEGLGDMGQESSELKMVIKDPAEDSANPPSYKNNSASFQLHNAVTLGVDQQVIDNVFSNYSTDCIGSNGILPVIGKKGSVSGHDLKAEKLYSCIYIAKYKPHQYSEFKEQEVYKHVFKTSRYASFSEHIGSFIIGQKDSIDIKALYSFDKTFSGASATTAQEIVQGTLDDTDSVVQQFPIVFDRITEGALGFGAMENPDGLEVNQVKDEITGKTIGILLRSPEPINDPRLTKAILDSAIKLKVDSGSGYTDVTGSYKLYASEDNARFFITNSALDITDTDWKIEFDYKRFDESVDAVQTQTSENITFILS